MPDQITRHRIKMKICGGGGGPASHRDQGRHSRFTARVLQRPARGEVLTVDILILVLIRNLSKNYN